MLLLVLYPFIIISQIETKKNINACILPKVNIKTLSGENFNTSNISNEGKPIIINFWATNCKPCVKELSVIADLYDYWQAETGVKIVAVSVDDSKTMFNVAPFVNGKGWEYEFYLDPNGDFKRAMNVNMIPHTFIINSDKEIVWQHVSYTEGDELQYIEVVKNILREQINDNNDIQQIDKENIDDIINE